jgi:hypothetical protein
MNLEQLQRDLKTSYNIQLETTDLRIKYIIEHLLKEWHTSLDRLTFNEMQILSNCILETETQVLHNEVESLLAKKEQIERKIDKKSHELQESKYKIFDYIESHIDDSKKEALSKLHQVKLQTIDLFDILGEIVESAIITALEKDTEIHDSIEEVVKDITFEAIKEGSLNTLRIRKILSTILHSSIEVAEASPVKAQAILIPTLKGIRLGLVHAITRFKQRIVFIPIEAKHLLIEDYEIIINDLNHTDALFSQVVRAQATQSSSEIEKVLEKICKDMRFDLDELLRISIETADVMKNRFSSLAVKAVNQADRALQSSKAKEAKRMGKQALGIAKTALDSALNSAKHALENSKK